MAISISKSLSSPIILLVVLMVAMAKANNPWREAHATFYGGANDPGTFGGACGYEEGQVKELFGMNTTALSTVLFDGGKTCGGCYEIKCADHQKGCKLGGQTITVTATNFCPPSGWCSAPNEHFDLTEPAFLHIAEYKAGIVPVQYRRVPCKKQRGIQFTINGNPYFNLVTVANVGGAGDVAKLEVSAAGAQQWTVLRRNYGQKWETDAKLVGQVLSFRITTSDGKTLTLSNVISKDWQFGKTYEGTNFM